MNLQTTAINSIMQDSFAPRLPENTLTAWTDTRATACMTADVILAEMCRMSLSTPSAPVGGVHARVRS